MRGKVPGTEAVRTEKIRGQDIAEAAGCFRGMASSMASLVDVLKPGNKASPAANSSRVLPDALAPDKA